MVKSKKTGKKEANTAAEVENSTEVPIDNEPEDNVTQENGVGLDVSSKKKTKGKPAEKKQKSEDEVPEKNESDNIVENGEEKDEKKKPPAKAAKKQAKKEPKPQVEPERKSSRTPKPVLKEGDSNTSYEVEKIIDSRIAAYGRMEYLVRWKGYSKGDDTWEDERDLNCPELLQKFKSENPGSEKKAKKRPSKSPAKAPAVKKTKKVEKDYEVEEIVGYRMKNGKKEFKIRWKGYNESDDSWEPEKNLSCQDLIKKYLEEHGDEVQNEEKKTLAKKTTKKAKKTPAKSAKGKKAKRK